MVLVIVTIIVDVDLVADIPMVLVIEAPGTVELLVVSTDAAELDELVAVEEVVALLADELKKPQYFQHTKL